MIVALTTVFCYMSYRNIIFSFTLVFNVFLKMFLNLFFYFLYICLVKSNIYNTSRKRVFVISFVTNFVFDFEKLWFQENEIMGKLAGLWSWKNILVDNLLKENTHNQRDIANKQSIFTIIQFLTIQFIPISK